MQANFLNNLGAAIRTDKDSTDENIKSAVTFTQGLRKITLRYNPNMVQFEGLYECPTCEFMYELGDLIKHEEWCTDKKTQSERIFYEFGPLAVVRLRLYGRTHYGPVELTLERMKELI